MGTDGRGDVDADVESTYDATAVLGRRYGAFFIDAAICLIVFGVLFFATADTHTRAEMLRVPGCHLSANDSAQVECNNRAVVTVNDTVYETEFGLFAGLSVVFTLLYFALVEGLTGGSLGKHMTGLRVVTPEGARPGFGRSLARWALFAIDGPLTPLHLRDHHVGGVGGPPPTRRHGRRTRTWSRAADAGRPVSRAPALTSADARAPLVDQAARRSTSRRSGSSASRRAVNHCASTIS